MLTCQKDLFYLPGDLHYLNCAYMAPLARSVEAAGIEGIRRKRVPSAIKPEAFFQESDQVRASFARLVNVAEPERIALIPSASYGIATAARNVHLTAGQNLVVVHEQFPSNIYAWQRLRKETGVEIRTINPPTETTQRGAQWNTRLLESIDTQTGLVALPHVHWADGSRFDLEQIGRRAREVGAAFIIDGTQSVGALPFDVQHVQPDALICAGYKWMLGPYSIGVAYFGSRFEGGIPLEENWIARRGSEHFGGLVQYQDDYQPSALRYDVGERSNFILLPMLLAGLTLIHDWGPEAIQTYCRALSSDVLADAQSLGFQLEEEAWRGSHLFGLRVPKQLSMDRLQTALAALNVSASIRGNAVRLAPHVYNNTADMEALREALHRCAHHPGSRSVSATRPEGT